MLISKSIFWYLVSALRHVLKVGGVKIDAVVKVDAL